MLWYLIFITLIYDLKCLFLMFSCPSFFSYWFSWERTRHLCQLRRRYVQLYATLLQQATTVDISEIREIEKILDTKVIILWRCVTGYCNLSYCFFGPLSELLLSFRLLGHAKVETVKSKETLHRKGASKKRWWPFGWFVNIYWLQMILVHYSVHLILNTRHYYKLNFHFISICVSFMELVWNSSVLFALLYLVPQGCTELFVLTLDSDFWTLYGRMLLVEFLTQKLICMYTVFMPFCYLRNLVCGVSNPEVLICMCMVSCFFVGCTWEH